MTREHGLARALRRREEILRLYDARSWSDDELKLAGEATPHDGAIGAERVLEIPVGQFCHYEHEHGGPP